MFQALELRYHPDGRNDPPIPLAVVVTNPASKRLSAAFACVREPNIETGDRKLMDIFGNWFTYVGETVVTAMQEAFQRRENLLNAILRRSNGSIRATAPENLPVQGVQILDPQQLARVRLASSLREHRHFAGSDVRVVLATVA